MIKNKFKKLVETLNIDPIVFIDNDFQAESNPGNIIYKLTKIPDLSLKWFFQSLKDKDEALYVYLSNFIDKIKSISIDVVDNEYFQSGILEEAFSGKYNNVITKEEITALNEEILKANSSNEYDFKELLLAAGLLNSTLDSYNFIIKELSELNRKPNVKFYTGLPGKKLNDFIKTIGEEIKEAGSNNFMLIVDKQLAGGEDGRATMDSLSNLCEREKIRNFISIIYTSKGEEKLMPDRLPSRSHLIMQIRKPEGTDYDIVLDKLSQSLAFCAYNLFFNTYISSKKLVLDTVDELLNNNETSAANVIYLAEQAYSEGVTIFKVIEEWIEMMTKKTLIEKLVESTDPMFGYRYIISLTSLFSNDFFTLSNFKVSPEQLKQLDLSIFEIFDYKINKFHSPPTIGDIFDINGQLFVLVGQECDLIVRENGSEIRRREQLAELVEAEFILGKENEEKLNDKNREHIEISHFEYNGNLGLLKVYFNRRKFFDFKLLDLTVLNTEGVATLPKNSEKVVDVNLLPQMWQKYLPFLVTELNKKLSLLDLIKKSGNSPNSIFPDDSLLLEPTTGDETQTFPIIRLCRIKGNFNKLLITKLSEYKNRVALNTIKIYNREQAIISKVKCGFSGSIKDVSTIAGWKILRHRMLGGDLTLVIYKSDILKVIPPFFQSLFPKDIEEEILIKNREQYFSNNLIRIKKSYSENANTYEVIIEFGINNKLKKKYFFVQKDYSLEDLIPEGLFLELTGKEQITVAANKKTSYKSVNEVQISHLDLKKGVTIPEINLSIKISEDEGVLDNFTIA